MDRLTRKEAFSLAKDAYYKKSSLENYTAEDRQEGLRNYLNDLSKDFRNNKNEIYQIIEDTVNEVLPKRVLDTVSQFAEVRIFNNGDTVRFRIKNGKIKAVSLAIGAVAERQRVDRGYATIKTENIQCKVYEEYERFLCGLVDWAELINDLVQAINDAIFEKIYVALKGVYAKLPEANVHSAPTMDLAELDRIVATVKAYGTPIIMGTPLAVQQITPDANLVTEADKMDIRTKGFLGMRKGCPIVELPQSFEDETNTKRVFDDQYLFIIPAGAEKVVKVALEGGLITREGNGADWTMNFEAYQKVGTFLLFVNNIGMYKITGLAQ